MVTYSEVETAIRAVHTRFMTELFDRDERIDGPEAWLPLVEELTTGPVLARLRESTAARVENGNAWLVVVTNRTLLMSLSAKPKRLFLTVPRTGENSIPQMENS